MAEAFDVVDIIRTKRDRGTLGTTQIDWLVDAYTRGYVEDPQMAALAMAILLNGMDRREIHDLTMAMIASGERMDFSSLDAPTVDKHSTGGVGDKITLPLMPLVAAFGAAVPQLSGRGLGHTGGTLDKLESIPGWRADLSNQQMLEQLRTVGGVICAAGAGLAPADKRLYALRDITGTVTSFREVDFSTAGMGFVLVMNEAALVGAPHSFIATVYAEEAAEAQILRDISNSYPNVTAIRVRDAIDRVTEVLGSIAAATAYGAAATLLTGFLVLIGASAAGQQNRTYEAAILKTLGATRQRILLSFTLRGLFLGASAGIVAIAAGILGGWAVSTFVLESDFEVIWGNALAIVIGGIVATLLAGLAFASGPLKAKPAGILRTAD